nr:trypacidin cluster transcription factor [Quercus suber]
MKSTTASCSAHSQYPRSPPTSDVRLRIRRSNTMDSQTPNTRPKAHRKLKESCNECGFAKVKCSKEKPQCLRCKERGLSCGYDFSSRAGRRLASSRTSTSDPSFNSAVRHRNTSQPKHQHYTSSSSSSPVSMAHNPTLLPPSTSTAEMAAFGYFSDAFGMNDYSLDYLTPSASPVMPCSVDMPIAPTMNLGHLNEHSTGNILTPTSYFNEPSVQMNPTFSPPPMLSPDTLPVSPVTPDTLMSSRPSSAGSAVCHEVLRGNSSCLSKVLNVLSIQERGRQSSDYDSGACSPAHNMNSVEDAIHANRTILDAATSTLDCHCLCTSSQLIYLLVSTAFDVMSRYAKAATYPDLVIPSPSLQAFAMANASSGYPNTDIAPARLVFGELHKVLRFIDLLAQRFQELNSLHRPGPQRHDSFISGTSNVAMSNIGNISSSYKPQEMHDSWKDQAVCVSDATFHALESDLRRRLKEIRDGILAQLRSRTI